MPELATVSTYDEDSGEMAIFILNTNLTQDITLDLQLEEFGELQLVEQQVLTGEDLFAVNSFESPNNVMPVGIDVTSKTDTQFQFVLPKTSWTMLRFKQN